MQSTSLNPLPQPLPATVEDLLACRKIKEKRTINDQVEEIHLKLITEEDYRQLLFAAYDEQAVEKNMDYDTIRAALMVRQCATDIGNHELAAVDLPRLKRSLNVVLRRYGLSREQRRAAINGA